MKMHQDWPWIHTVCVSRDIGYFFLTLLYNKTDFFLCTRVFQDKRDKAFSTVKCQCFVNCFTIEYYCGYIKTAVTHTTAHTGTHTDTHTHSQIHMHTTVHKCTLNISQVKAFIPLCRSLRQCVHPSKQSMISLFLPLPVDAGAYVPRVFIHMCARVCASARYCANKALQTIQRERSGENIGVEERTWEDRGRGNGRDQREWRK